MNESKNDIAKKFDLPERKSKIASIIKQSDKKYCICRSTDSTGFMIGCECCEEWYHGDCININQTEAKNIKKYFCDICIDANPGMQIIYKKQPKNLVQKEKIATPPMKPVKKGKKESSSGITKAQIQAVLKKCPNLCSGCMTNEDCGKCPPCLHPELKQICVYRDCLYSGTSCESDWADLLPPVKKKQPPTKTKRGPKARRSQKTVERVPRKPVSLTESSENEDDKLRQCFGPACQKPALPGSKYCSSECGIALASDRLYLILPARIQEWSFKKAVAAQHNDRDLLEVKKKQESTQKMIKELQSKRDKLDEHIARIERLKFDPDFEEDDGDEEGLINCVSCGKEVSVRDSLKHMEKCYNKFEGQTSFGSIYKTNVEGTPLFCDFLNPTNETYCKRLKVLCAEHTKEGKISDTEVCGCPFDKEVRVGGRVCNNAKKKCNKHYGWEKLRRAEIDMERVRQLLKLDELLEQERQILQAKQDRGGVLGMLLNSTFDHDLDNALRAEQALHEKQLNNIDALRKQHEAKRKHKKLSSSESSSSSSNDSDSEDSPEEEYGSQFVDLKPKRVRVRDHALPPRSDEVTASKLSFLQDSR